MVHWIEGVDLLNNDPEFLESIGRLRRDYWSTRGDIFFQFWVLNEYKTIDTKVLKSDEKFVTEYTNANEKLIKHVRKTYALVPSWREHMPDTTVKINLENWIQEIRKWYSSSGKRYINKAKKEDLEFDVWSKKDRSRFWEIRYSMSYDKGFSIVWKDTFLQLMEHLTQHNQWWLYLAKKWSKIVSWSVVLEFQNWKEKELIYLYWATNREFWNIWWHYRLTDNIMKRWAHSWYVLYDLLWVAPPWNDKHYLSWVTRFKQAFWGKTILSHGNYDLVFNSMLYRTMQMLKK